MTYKKAGTIYFSENNGVKVYWKQHNLLCTKELIAHKLIKQLQKFLGTTDAEKALIQMEFGFKQHEKGNNLEMAREEMLKVYN